MDPDIDKGNSFMEFELNPTELSLPNMEEIFTKQQSKKTSWTATTCMSHRICYRHRSKALLEVKIIRVRVRVR